MTRNDAVNMVNNFKLDFKGSSSIWPLVHIKTPIEVIKEEAFGRTCFRDTYSGINSKWYT